MTEKSPINQREIYGDRNRTMSSFSHFSYAYENIYIEESFKSFSSYQGLISVAGKINMLYDRNFFRRMQEKKMRKDQHLRYHNMAVP